MRLLAEIDWTKWKGRCNDKILEIRDGTSTLRKLYRSGDILHFYFAVFMQSWSNPLKIKYTFCQLGKMAVWNYVIINISHTNFPDCNLVLFAISVFYRLWREKWLSEITAENKEIDKSSLEYKQAIFHETWPLSVRYFTVL